MKEFTGFNKQICIYIYILINVYSSVKRTDGSGNGKIS